MKECREHKTKLLRTAQKQIHKLENPKIWNLTQYEASDLKIFDNSAKWYPWQKDLMEILFDKDLTLRNLMIEQSYGCMT